MSVGTIFDVQIVGTVLLFAFVQGFRIQMPGYHLGVAWYISTVLVPTLLVTHTLIAIRLSRRTHTRHRVPKQAQAYSVRG